MVKKSCASGQSTDFVFHNLLRTVVTRETNEIITL